jgi:hypothetical protein
MDVQNSIPDVGVAVAGLNVTPGFAAVTVAVPEPFTPFMVAVHLITVVTADVGVYLY